MSRSSRESNLAQLREALAQLNSELFLTMAERRSVCVRIQEFKDSSARYSSYDPVREKEVFGFISLSLKSLA